MVNEGVEQYENNEELLKELNHKDGILVFPWEFRTGYINNTENGYVDDDNPNNVNYLEKVFTGKENICVVWEKSTINVKPKNHNVMETIYGRGRYYIGKLISGRTDLKTVIEPIEDNDTFLSMKDDDTITISFYFPPSTLLENAAKAFNDAQDTHYFYPTDDDKKKLYTIPEIGGDKFYYISNVNLLTSLVSSKVIGCEIEFSSVKDLLRKSGQASEQFIQYSAPGEPYSKPKITINENGEKEVSFTKVDKPRVNYFQFEMLGAGNITGISIMGRKFTNKNNSIEFTEWKFLLPYKFYTTQNNQLTHSAAPSKCLFYFPNETIDVRTSIDWAENFKLQNNAIARNNIAGKLTCGKVADWQGGTKVGNHKSNLAATTGIRYDFFDDDWKPLSYLTSFSQYNLLGNMYCENEITFNKDMSAIQILIANSFMFLSQPQLPLSFMSSKPYRWSNAPIIGTMISVAVGDRTLNPNTISRTAMPIGYFMDADLASYFSAMGVQPESGETQHAFFLNSFADEEVNEWMGVLSQNLSMCFELTDKFSIIPNGETETKTFDTKYLGQYQYEPTWDEEQQKEIEGDYILDSHNSILYNTTLNPLKSDSDEGFIIDKVIIFSNFMGKIRLSCYSKENDKLDKPCFATTILSQPEFTKDFRQWMTVVSLGGWKDKYISASDNFTYPKYPTKTGNDIKQIDYKDYLELNNETDITSYIIDKKTTSPIIAKISRDKEYSFAYTEFLPDLTTKEQFLARYSGIRLYCSLFEKIHEHDYFYDNDRIASKRAILEVSFNSVKTSFYCSSFGTFDNPPTSGALCEGKCLDEYFEVRVSRSNEYTSSEWKNAKYSLYETISINLDDENVKINLNSEHKISSYLKDKLLDTNTIHFPVAGIPFLIFNGRTSDFYSQIVIDRIEFIRK